MDALYPRLLVRDFPAAVDFYRGVLAELFDIQPVKVIPEAAYANWDIDGQTGLVLYGQAVMAETIGTTALHVAAESQDGAMLVFKVDSVDAAVTVFERFGASVLAPAQDRPQWGPTLRTAHLRAPDGTLVEIQSY
ncbi:glyoxalase/bleomycin resistance/extradiol dioxygenase family protein [Kribbella qitaiheensis]|uniref:Glyoxalase/bleomycin resistance/extradiol dioxygenase family protein n=1 Tax=Kribbella qitaiheensis TaxID=1544730 RepID=A0A7G6X2H9_9ACTN|nr:VOC family protein [Kribbella qitaiheensis]QNE20444.1 glyoxalase/bleomycin resistance/extradiol dioxygenase family protein [Kribbella qitaiheensis]